MSFSEQLVAGRTKDFAGAFADADDVAVNVASGSNVRFKVYRRGGATPVLDLDESATANGSVTAYTAGTPNYTVHIDQRDTADLVPGPYSVEISVVDVADDKIKHAEFGVLTILSSPAGSTGI